MSKIATVQALKNKLKELYSQHNPENVGKIDYLLQKYDGNEQLLYTSVCTKYSISPLPLTRKVKEWDAATGKNQVQIICETTGELLETLEEEEDEEEYDPFSTAPSGADKDRLTEDVIKQIDCHLLGVIHSNMFVYPDDQEAEEQLQKVTAVDSMGEL
ncbi:unnamed protein product [Amoebophrya sp. A25]|nr:unnamed protein product [Amoebophrya sp. A25]|eukprot:GSA25T00009796001.1